MSQAQTERDSLVPLQAGMFEMPDSIDGVPRLLGQRCLQCGELFALSRRVHCPNCSADRLEGVTFIGTGEVTSYTTIHQQLSGALVKAPYIMAQVRLTEGVGIRTVLVDIDPAVVRVGLPVEVCLRPLQRTDDGATIVNFFFRPAVV